jgi:hypothetical protein
LWLIKKVIIYFAVSCTLCHFSNVNIVIADDSYFTTTEAIDFLMYKGEQKSKFLEFYGLSDNVTITFIKSDLTSKDSDNYISANNIEFSNISGSTLYLDKGEIKRVKISITADNEGAFAGNLFLQNNQNNTITKLPITLQTLPDWPFMVFLFMSGFGASSIFWAWRTLGGLKTRFDEIKKQVSYLDIDFEHIRAYVINYYPFSLVKQLRFQELIAEMKSSNVNEAEKKLADIKENIASMAESQNFDKEKFDNVAAKLSWSPDELLQDIISKVTSSKGPNFQVIEELKKIKFNYWKRLFSRSSIFFNVAAILLGLIIALGTFFQQENINTLRSIDWRYMIVIISLGAGIDNLKQILERLFDKTGQ